MNLDKLMQALSRHENGFLFPKTEIPHSLTGDRIRVFLNEIVSHATVYLECGVYCGGTFCAATHDNTGLELVIAIDSWAENFGITKKFGIRPQDEFYKNIKKFYPANVPLLILERDHWTVEHLPKAPDVFFYDGNHDAVSQERALTHYGKMCAKKFVYVVDDYNWPKVQEGTAKGLKHFDVEYSIALGNGKDSDSEYWNGIGVFLLNQK